ncbi:PTS transporter subunit IIC [Aliibacillus thermotolerans]|uniref:PTS transporter subunit IIC n=1 Tax=Aliibacillus thermotolerans TaxID=1834418 RepID=A0ABW0U7J0_9BACI|nr:PTS sugar transporter subunit IIC [Aliibacillus thermotolerans]MDA3129762.1 PTS sugar transporter subunit IIC [Aliibacillus thermotolerans]
MRDFFLRKGVNLSVKTYIITALSYMALGLFASLIVGLIIKTIGEQLGWPYFVNMGQLAMDLMGPAIGGAIAYGLQAPPLVLFSAVITGAAGAELGGPAGAYVASVLAVEMGKLISKETRLDIIVTPFVTIFTGFTVSYFFGPAIYSTLVGIGEVIMWATDQRPFIMGIVVAVLMGLALTAPISSAAIGLMLNLEGLAAGAATVGCSAQMIGFAVSSYRENGVSGLAALGLGTSMLQVPNILKKPIILIPPTVAGIVFAPLSTMVFMMENNAAGAGMGTSGLVGQVMTFEAMGFTMEVFIGILILQIIGPAIVSLLLSEWMRKKQWIKPGDMKIELG